MSRQTQCLKSDALTVQFRQILKKKSDALTVPVDLKKKRDALTVPADLKKKSDTLTVRFRQILKKIVSTKESMKTSSFALTEAKYVAGDNIKHVVLENVREASLCVCARQDNVVGVKLPKFDYTADSEATNNDLIGLAWGAQSLSKDDITDGSTEAERNKQVFFDGEIYDFSLEDLQVLGKGR